MSNKNSIEVVGLDEIFERFEEVEDINKFIKSMEKSCALVERDAKKNAPKGDGHLRRSITSKVTQENGTVKGAIFTSLEYAPYVEFGTGLFAEGGGRTDVPWCYQDEKGNWHSTSGMRPSPFMRPALNDNRENIKRILKEGLGE